MSSFLKQGQRKEQVKKKKIVQKHLKAIYSKLDELNAVALDIIDKEDLSTITEDNIVEVASKYSDVSLEEYEKSILLSKLEDYKNRVIDEAK